MRRKYRFNAWVAMASLVAAFGCGMDGPAPSNANNAGGTNNANNAGGAKSVESGDGVKLVGRVGDHAGPAIPENHRASWNNLTEIGFAMQNYAVNNRIALPPSASAKNGKPHLSWRVRILPYLGEDALYKRYHLDEPWDSPHNLDVAKTMPKAYQAPGRPVDGKTCYLSFAGNGAALDGNDNISWEKLTPTSRAIVVVEVAADKAVPWTKPEDLPFNPANPLAAIGQIPPDGLFATMADGEVMWCKNLDNATLKAMIVLGGSEKVDLSKVLGD
jgi:hypothetical protein